MPSINYQRQRFRNLLRGNRFKPRVGWIPRKVQQRFGRENQDRQSQNNHGPIEDPAYEPMDN